MLDQVSYYQRSGFGVTDFRVTQYKGKPNPDQVQGFRRAVPGVEVTQLTPSSLRQRVQALSAYDQSVHGVDRQEYLELALSSPNTTVFIALQGGGKICGYSYWENVEGKFSRIRSVYADTDDVGTKLLAECVMCSVNQSVNEVVVMITERNYVALQFVNTTGLKPYIEADRLYTKEPINTKYDKVFALSTMGNFWA